MSESVHYDSAEKDSKIPSIANAVKCNKPECPELDKLVIRYGLAGGEMGPYVYCKLCGDIRGKDCDPLDEL